MPVLLGFVAASGCSGITLTGVLYSDEGGASGAGTGEIRLAANGKMYTIRYQEPYLHHFSRSNCSDPGAIWFVEVSGRELASTKCSGQMDIRIHDSWLLVKRFLSELQQRSAHAAEMISIHWRRSEEFKSIQTDIQSLQLDQYVKFGRDGRCLQTVSKPDSTFVEIEAGDDCYLFAHGKPISAWFTVEHRNPGETPVITRIRLE